MTILIDLSVAGINTGPFNLYSDADGYTSAFATNITRQQLLDGYPATVPNGTTNIKFQSLSNVCPNDTILPVISITTTTTTTIPTCINPMEGWSTTNLNVSTYNDGITPIPEVTDQNEWENLTTGAWCYYANMSSNGPIYGKLYNWYAVAGIWNEASKTDPGERKQLAPAGYHVASNEEWTTLIDCLGGPGVAGGKMKSTGTIEGNDGLWLAPNTGATNESGFTGLPGSYRYTNGPFNPIGTRGFWWTSTDGTTAGEAFSHQMTFDDDIAYGGDINKRLGFSVRIKQD